MRSKFKWIFTLLLAFSMQFSFAQEKTITGTITDKGMPLPGVSIVVKGTTRGTQSDFDGNYSIQAAQGETIIFSYVGYTTQNVVVGASNTISVTLLEDATILADVVVVGYGSKTRDEMTSAVSVLSSEEIAKLTPTTTIDNMLQGKAAGVSVVGLNGKPGETAFVRIRGVGSIQASSAPLYVIDGVVAPDLSNINPGDIESMSVLKDAATASIYGSRAANGVIIVTTKQGSRTKAATITYTSRYGLSQKIEDNFRMMNASEKLQYERELASIGVAAAQGLPGATVTDQAAYDRLLSYNHDWQKTLLRRGVVQSNALSIAGGSQDFTYYMSVAHDRNEGIIRDVDGFERLSSRLNVTYKAKPWLEVGANVSISGSTTNDPRDRNNVQNPIAAMYNYNPYEPLYLRDDNGAVALDENGNPTFNPTRQGFPISEALINNPENITNTTLLGGMFANVQLTDKIMNIFRIGASDQAIRREYYVKPGSFLDDIVGDADNPGSKTDNGSTRLDYTITNLLSYADTFAEKHNFKVTGLYEFNRETLRTYSLSSIGFSTPNISVQSIAAVPTAVSTNFSVSTLQSYGAFLDYDFDKKYIATASIRRDQSSTFGVDNTYGVFWSASAAWNISNEDFMSGSVINDLKLRASAGTSGNRNLGVFYPSKTLVGFGSLNGGSIAAPTQVGNPDLGFESNFIVDVGLEFGMFNNRLRGVVDYYERTTDDLFLDRFISAIGGEPNGEILSNIGEIVNKGLELTLSGDIVRNQDFTLTVGGNIAFLDNEVTKLQATLEDPSGADREFDNSILRVGEEFYTYYMPRWAGVNPANGQPLFYDADNNVTTEYDASASQVLSGKSPLADLEGGFNLYANYKGFDLAADFFFKAGNYVYNYMEQNALSDGTDVASNQRVDAFNYWTEPGQTNVLPSPLYGTQAQQFTDRFLQKGDFIRLRNLTVGYNVPTKFLDRTGLQGIRFFVQGQNLWTYVPYFKGDPEVGIGSGETAAGLPGAFGQYNLYSYPQTQSLSFGVDVKF